MASGRNRALALAVALGLTPRFVAGQDTPPVLARALDLETAGKCREAVVAYREALGLGDPTGALLGLERCYAQVGPPDTLLHIVDSVLARRPRDPVARVIMLRTLSSARRYDDARQAFERWVAAVPREATPFREYVRILLDDGRSRAADTVLEYATRALGGRRELAAEQAELHAQLGMWEASAKSWRDALSLATWLEQSAVFVLTQAPAAARDSVRAVLAAPPAELPARRILAGLEMRWRSAREAWQALRELTPGDSVIAAWLEFAREAEQQGAWLTARDVFALALEHSRGSDLALPAALAALQGGDPASALEFVAKADSASDSASVATRVLLRIRALSDLGRGAEADSVLQSSGAALDPITRGDAVRAVAWGWIRGGDLDRARSTLAAGGEDTDERASAWIALYEGDLATARAGLRRLDETTSESVLAQSVLSRTRADTAPGIGAAFLTLARRDTAAAAAKFESVAQGLPDAAPLLLGIAARLYAATADSLRSVTIWKTLIEKHPDAPEAAEAELDWARSLRRQGDVKGAIARLEHLILTYPESALVPQARRELELARGAIPPGD